MEPVDVVRSMLPWWVGWGPLIVVLPAIIGYSILATGSFVVSALRLARRTRTAHWTERARRLFPVRATLLTIRFVLPALAAMLAHVFTGPWSLLGPRTMALAAAASSALVCESALFFLERRCRPALRLSASGWLRGVVNDLLFRWPHYVAVLVTWLVLWDSTGGRHAIVVAVGAAAVMCIAWFGIPHSWLRGLGVFRAPSHRLERVVQRASAHTGTFPRAVYEITLTSTNAFALPTTGTLVFSESLVALLDDEQLEVVCAHELAHLGIPRGQLLQRKVAGTLPPLAFVGLRAVSLLHPLAGPVFVIAALVVSRALLLRASISEERRADAAAASHEHADGVYARALERIHEANLVPAVVRGRQTHPNLYDRMVASGAPPAYPKPEPPARLAPILVLVCVVTIASWMLGPSLLLSGKSVAAAARSVAFTAGGPDELAHLGVLLEAGGDTERSLAVFRACVLTSPDDVDCRIGLVHTHVAAGRCEDASRELAGFPASDDDDVARRIASRMVARCGQGGGAASGR